MIRFLNQSMSYYIYNALQIQSQKLTCSDHTKQLCRWITKKKKKKKFLGVTLGLVRFS